jgi:hypothetical protein
MAINGRFRVAMENVLPHGAYVVSEVAATRDFNKSTMERGLPFAAVEFEGLTVTPYVDESSARPRVAYSIRASGMHAPGKRAVGSPAGDVKVA